ncbi:MAG TPA: hypothetical protein VGB04_03385 [Allosphingosinicella sp.]|jgi:hypothetical protein
MRHLALLAILAVPAAAAMASTGVPLQALSEADVGADALKNAACYLYDGPSVLLVATKTNAVVNSDGDLRLLQRRGNDGSPIGGARYGGMNLEIVISPAAADDDGESGRSNRPAEVSVKSGKTRQSITARWSCNGPKGA